jgi:hypothetical protein
MLSRSLQIEKQDRRLLYTGYKVSAYTNKIACRLVASCKFHPLYNVRGALHQDMRRQKHFDPLNQLRTSTRARVQQTRLCLRDDAARPLNIHGYVVGLLLSFRGKGLFVHHAS